MADPSTMSDEELNKVIETGIEPDEMPDVAPEETPAVKHTEEPTETPETAPEVEEPATPEPEAPEESVEEPAQPSRREQLRINQLLAKYGDPTSRAPQPQQLPGALDYAETLDADPEVIQRLEADRQRVAQAEYSRGIQSLQYTQFYNNIRFDLPLVADRLSKLDPMDAKSIDDEYLAITGADTTNGYVRNPNIGYAEFVEARLEQAERLAASMSAKTAKNIAQQAAATGLRPDGSSAKRLNLNQSPDKMTMEELYAAIGNVGKPKE